MKANSSRVKSLLLLLLGVSTCLPSHAQVNSGSNGSDGVLHPLENLVIDMRDRPDGIYHYQSVNIPAGVEVTFIPNAGNTPLVWLVQGNVEIHGFVSVNGHDHQNGLGGRGGPGGGRGGNSKGVDFIGENGSGVGGGAGGDASKWGGDASFATRGWNGEGFVGNPGAGEAGIIYGNEILFPLSGGSGGGASIYRGGGGGGGALLIAASGNFQISGSGVVFAHGSGPGGQSGYRSGAGSGGAIRIIATQVLGTGMLNVAGGGGLGGNGRVRIDSMNDSWTGSANGGVISRGYNPIIIPPAHEAIRLDIVSIAGIQVAAVPNGSTIQPDVVIPANVQNPVTVVVRCQNIPLNSEIILEANPPSGPRVRVTALNNTGNQEESFATLTMNLPRGVGRLQAMAVSGIGDGLGALERVEDAEGPMLAQTGWTANGERFRAIEVTSTLGGSQTLTYITESGQRYVFHN